jgi:16S rRNA (guanine527-N7)-methyltransferase
MSDDVLQKKEAYATLLRQWNPRINLVSPTTLASLEERHIEDSAQLAEYLPIAPSSILDVGSGAGLPGLILAILAPEHTFTLAERDQRKAAFLHTAAHTLGLKNVKVYAGDVRKLAETGPHAFHVITCRAWADLKDILTLTSPLLAPKGCWLLLKGKAVDEELKVCGTLFHFTNEQWPSKVLSNEEERGWVLKITPAA